MRNNRKDRLETYEKIALGKITPRYLRTKEIKCDFDGSEDSESLWKIHDAVLSSKESRTTGKTNLLELKLALAERMMSDCQLCERRCGADRANGEKGRCGVLGSRISSNFVHMGEEPEVIPSYTIFFSGCTFKCVFCQNWDISTNPESGLRILPEKLAKMIEEHDPNMSIESDRLKRIDDLFPFFRPSSAKNVNWVGGDPTSNLPYILKTLNLCRSELPQVWNSNMYLTIESMKLLDGVIDLYLTDFKYGNDRCAKRLSGIDNYFEIVSRNHLLSAKQCDVIVRHLVLPNHIECCTKPILHWVSENIPIAVVNVMAQYRPEHRAREFEEISRPLRTDEYSKARKIAEDLGLNLTS